MLFWVLCALLTAAGLVLMLRPLVGAQREADDLREANIAIYKDQLEEIERDLDRELLNEEEAEAAKIEVSRRLLAAADANGDADGPAAGPTSKLGYDRITMGIAVVVVGSSLGTYLFLGSPGYPGKPHAERLAADVTKLPVEELIARVEARLKENPKDARGWDVIAPIYLKRQEYVKAAQAFQQALRFNGESGRRLAQFAEAILGATNGQVNDAVKTAYERLLLLQPNFVPAHFWLAVRHEQIGDQASAQQAYRKLLARKDLPADMRQLVRERLIAVTSGQPGPAPCNCTIRQGGQPITRSPTGNGAAFACRTAKAHPFDGRRSCGTVEG